MKYIALEYIESNGTQYIDTGFNPDGNTRIVAEMQLTELVNADKGTSPMLFGAYASSSARYAFYWSATGNVFGTYYAGQSKDFSSITNGYERVQIDCNKNTQSLNGETITYTASTSACSYPLYLFGRNTSGSAGFLAKARLYSCQIYDNDVLVRDFVPMANEQGVCGLYDNVNGVFYASANGNNFLGIRKDGLPVGYTLCEYIESNGTQYIDTGVAGQASVKAEFEFMLMEGGASIPLGCYSPSRLYLVSFDSDTYLRYGYSNWVNTSTKIEINERYSVSTNFTSGAQSITLDGVTIASSSILGSVVNNYNIYVFAYNDTGAAGDYSKIRCYGLKLYRDGILVRDYIPCQNSVGDYGLYDRVNNVFYTSPNGNAFTGYVKKEKDLPIEYTKCDYIESDGTQYIDTNYIPNSDTKIWIDIEVTKYVQSNFFGTYDSGTTKGFKLYLTKEGSVYHHYNTTYQGPSFELELQFPGRNQFVVDKNKAYINETQITQHTVSNFDCEYPLFLLSNNVDGSKDALPCMSAKIYGCKIYESDQLVRDFVPCVNSVNIYGLYDNISDCFYALKGNSENNSGYSYLDVSPAEFRHRLLNTGGGKLPRGYYECEYIESDGTNFIDTGFKPNQDTRIVIDFKGLQWGTNEVCMWMGVSSSPYFMFGKASSSNYRAYFYYKTSEVLFSESTAEEWETRQTLDWNKNVITWGGVSKNVTSSTFQCTDNAYLFAANNGSEAKFITRGRIYSCQIYDNGTLVRDYIPCVNPEGYFGLYDSITKTFFRMIEQITTSTTSTSAGATVSSGSWYKSASENPNSSLYDGLYISYNPGASNSSQLTLTNIKCSEIYIRSYGEACCDYVYVTNSSGTQLGSTAGTSVSGTALSNYTKVTIPSGTTTAYVYYTKDLSVDSGYDQGYLLVPKVIKTTTNTVVQNAIGSGKLILPSEYTWLPEIYGSGAYIDTGYLPNNNTKVLLKATLPQQSSYPTALLGSRNADSTPDNSFNIWCITNSAFRFDLQTTQNTINEPPIGNFEIEAGKGSFRINGSSITCTQPISQSNYNLTIFSQMCPSGIDTRYTKMYLQYCAILGEAEGALQRLFVPCKNSSNIYGVYDLITKSFYSSANNTPFEETMSFEDVDFSYNGKIQTITLPKGSYKLQVWGAQGGTYSSSWNTGGKGGYSEGILNVAVDTPYYIVVGGQGTGGASTSTKSGGYNGGAAGGTTGSYGSHAGCGGGGATHIATVSGLLNTLSSNKAAVVIVAGGGGGGAGGAQGGGSSPNNQYKGCDGGAGGGTNGVSGSSVYNSSGDAVSALSGSGGSPGFQSSGGSGGYGNGDYHTDNYDGDYCGSGGGGGGGGYYGGGGGGSGGTAGEGNTHSGSRGASGSFGSGGAGGSGDSDSDAYYSGSGAGGGGGSGYVNTSLLTSASTKAGNVSFVSVSGGTETGHSGNGYVRISKA